MKLVKYSISKTGKIFLFETNIIHRDVSLDVISAGFAIISYDSDLDLFLVKCFGKSESLQLSSNESDCKKIQDYLNNL